MYKFKNKNSITKNDEKSKKVDRVKNNPKIFASIVGMFKRIYKFFAFYITHYYKLILCILLSILLIIFSIYLYRYFYQKKYAPYEIKMQNYGFDKMYNNGKATSYENVTKSEAIKMILSSIYNIYDISDFAYETADTYNNAMWVEYAIKEGIIPKDSINSKNEYSSIKYIDVIKYYVDARSKLLNKPLSSTKKASFSDFEQYNTELQNYINDAVENKLIKDSKSKLKANKNITKAQLNQLVINFVEQYNTITLPGDKINIDPNKEPQNVNMYPYILSNVNKSIYEKPFTIDDISLYANPIDVYVIKKEYYSQIKEWSEKYYNTLLNVDYNNITIDNFTDALKPYVMYVLNSTEVSDYVDYVKNHKIKLSGTAKAQLPIIYYDGVDYRVRMKILFKVESSDTKDNLLFQDLNNDEPYTYNENNDMLIDAKLGNVYGQNSIYIYVTPISNLITKAE